MLCLCVNMYVYAGGGVYVHIEKPQDCAGVLLGHSRTYSESSCLGWGVLGWLPSYPPLSNPPQHWSYWQPWDCPSCSVNQNSCRVLLTTRGLFNPPVAVYSVVKDQRKTKRYIWESYWAIPSCSDCLFVQEQFCSQRTGFPHSCIRAQLQPIAKKQNNF